MPISRVDRDRFFEIYFSKGIHGATAIEGNAFSEDAAGRIIAGELQAAPSRAHQQRQIDNIDNMVKVWNEVADSILAGDDSQCALALFQ